MHRYFVAQTLESLCMVEINTVEFGNKDIGCNQYISYREAIGLKQRFNHFTTFCMYRISIVLCACMPENVCSCVCALVLFVCVRGCQCVCVMEIFLWFGALCVCTGGHVFICVNLCVRAMAVCMMPECESSYNCMAGVLGGDCDFMFYYCYSNHIIFLCIDMSHG